MANSVLDDLGGLADEDDKSDPLDDLVSIHPEAEAAPAAAPKKPSFMQGMGRAAALTGRALTDAVTSLPLMAMDAGVAARNIPAWLKGEKQPYELPSAMWNRGLNELGVPHPEGAVEKGASLAMSMAAGSRIPAPQAAEQAPAGFVSKTASKLTPAQQSALERGKAIGMKTTPGQEKGSKALQQVEAKLESQPWTSGPASAIKANNANVLNKTWAKAIGEDTDTIDSTVLSRAHDRLGEVFESVRDSRPRQIDPNDFLDKLGSIEDKFDGLLPKGSIAENELVKKLFDFAGEGTATGEQLGSLTSKLGRVASKNMTTPSGDRDLGMALYEVKDMVDDLVAKGLSGEEKAAYGLARKQYRALMQLQSRVGNLNPNTGNVNANSMASYLQKSDKKGFLYGNNDSDAYAATRFAQAFKPIVADSGTATRGMSMSDLLKLPLGAPANLLSRAYYKGLITPSAPTEQTIQKTIMGTAAGQ